MSDDNVFDIKTGEPVSIPAAEESSYVESMETSVHEVLMHVQAMQEATDEAQFRAYMRDVKAMVRAWP